MTTTPARARPSRLRWLWAVAALPVAVVLVPDLVGLDRFTPFAQAVAFRPILTAVTAPVLLLAAAVPLVRRRAAAALVTVALVVLTAGVALVPRVLPDGAPAPTGPELTVLALNTLAGDATPEDVTALVAEHRPALVSLPEAGADYRDRIAPLVEPLGYRVYSSTSSELASIRGVVAIVRADLGDVEVGSDFSVPFPAVVVTGGGLGDLRFVAWHAAAPLPQIIDWWRSDQAHLATWCAADTPVIVAGDFNASLDHSTFRAGTDGCTDAAAQTGDGLVGTWPAQAPRWMGAQIDHVLVSGGIAAQEVQVVDVANTDHRAVVARLRLP